MMRLKILIILTVFLFLFSGYSSAQKEIFIKLIEFRLDHISDQDYENEYFMTIKFNKGSTYKIKVTNHLESYAGEAVFELLDADKLVLTNLVGEKYYDVFSFVCSKTGFYDILIRFKDNKLGNSVIDIKLLQ
ncbi:MAG: hypothetical protein JSV22_01745 [Bacteroidales bacterium]|nr:MAG: hypothetical protein JSV22_01745 [Bacteroidales bacterium]